VNLACNRKEVQLDFAMSGTVLTRDLFSADGRKIAGRGEVLDLPFLRDVASRAPRNRPERPLHETFVADAVLEAFEAPALSFLVQTQEARAQIADGLVDVRFPQGVWDELEAMQRSDPARYQHAVWSAVVAVRLFRAALGNAPGIARLAGGALVHDIGMVQAAPRLRFKRDHLTRAEALSLEDHPLLGALILASEIGDAPAVHFALLHHTRAGQGYPRVEGKPPLRGLDLVAVASAFAALIAPRSFRVEPFNARGAADQILEESIAGFFDVRAARLLIHCLRGAKGALADLRLPRRATGQRPSRNHHGVASESMSAPA